MSQKRKKLTEEFFSGEKYFAHRGLHDGLKGLPWGEGIPENSIAAFERACEAGYGIELDVHVTADDKLVVFHDDTLDRMCRASGNVEEMTLAELQGISLWGTSQHIPSFEEVLSAVCGRGTLVIELKGQSTKSMRVCELTAEALKSYNGKWCIESFNPFYVEWWRKNCHEAIRGILSCKMPPDKFMKNRFLNFVLENMLLNIKCRPDFIAYGIDSCKRLAFKAARAMGGYPVGWTARGEEEIKRAEKDFKAIIFEKS